VKGSRALLVGGAVALAFLGGAWLRLRLDADAWWFNPDEGIYHVAATSTHAEYARATREGNAHPPLFWRVTEAAAAVDDSRAALRFPSLAAGLLSILALAWLGHVAGGPAGAVLGALVGALSPPLGVQSVLVRPYAMQVLFLTLALAALLAYLESRGRGRLVVFSACLTVAAFLHYSTIVAVGGIAVVLLVAFLSRKLEGRAVRDLALALAVPAAAFAWLYVTHVAPGIVGGSMHRNAREGWLRTAYVESPAEAVRALSSLGRYLSGRPLAVPVSLLTVAAVVAAVVERRGRAALLLVGTLATGLALSFAGLLPFGGTRHSLFFLPVVVAAAAAGLAAVVRLPRAAPRFGPQGPRLVALLLVLAAGWAGYRLVRATRAAVAGDVYRTFPEQVVRVSTLSAVLAALDRSPRTTWVTDPQTHYLLMPALPPDERVDRPVRGTVRELRGWGRRFLFARPWMLPDAPLPADDPLESVLALLAEEGAPSDGRVALVIGGWGVSLAWRLAGDFEAQGRAVHEAAGGEDLALVVVDLADFRAWRAARAAEAR
jgi:hypothetical protein